MTDTKNAKGVIEAVGGNENMPIGSSLCDTFENYGK